MPQVPLTNTTPAAASPTRRRPIPIPSNKLHLLPGPAVAHPDAGVLRLLGEIQANDVREEAARAKLPDPDFYTYLGCYCDPATLKMDQVHGHGLHLRDELANAVAVTLDGLHAKAAVVASDAGIDAVRPDTTDWREFEVCDVLSMSVLRDLLMLKPEQPRVR